MEMERIVNVYADNWIEDIAQLAFSNHLVCTGKRSDLQWFGTRLIQRLGNYLDSETGSIYGKLAIDFDDFCYQLCHCTPWGFDMGRNWNAVRDVIRGDGSVENRFFILYDAQFLYFLDNYKYLEQLFQIFIEVAEEKALDKQNLKVIILLEAQENVSVRRLVRRKEKYPIEELKIIQEE